MCTIEKLEICTGIRYSVLTKAGVEEARQDAWLLLEHVCGISHSTYFVHSEDEMPKNSRSSTKRWSESAANTFRCSS